MTHSPDQPFTPSFNLLDEPWIPCTGLEGRSRELSLRRVLGEAHALRDLNGESPLVNVALYRLLLAMLHRAYDGPRDRRQWAAMWQRGSWDVAALDTYFAQWHDRFDIFHPQRPFMQQRREGARLVLIAALIPDVASGGTPTLFNHHMDSDELRLTPAEASRALLTGLIFGLLGRRTGSADYYEAAPGTGGIHFLLEGANLFETLMLNWIRYDEEGPMPRVGTDLPIWEREDLAATQSSVPHGYLDYLTWQNADIWLSPEVIDGKLLVRSYTSEPGRKLERKDTYDPFRHYLVSKESGLYSMRFQEDKALWRNSSTLLQLSTDSGKVPAALAFVSTLVSARHLDRHRRGYLRALGMASSKAKVEFVRDERLPLPLIYLADDAQPAREALDTAIKAAEKAAHHLWGAARTLARYLASPDVDSGAREPRREDLDQIMGQWDIERRYWSQLETEFYVLMERLPDEREQASAAWTAFVRATALASFDGVSAGLDNTPRVLKAWVFAGRQLAAGLAQDLPLPKEPANAAA